MAIIGESRDERRNREAQLDDNRRNSTRATGEPLEYIDEFTHRAPLDSSVLDRLPKCLSKRSENGKEKESQRTKKADGN